MIRTLFAVSLFRIVAQAQDASLQFEVASIKPSDPLPSNRPIRMGPSGGPGTDDPEMFRCSACTPAMLVLRAYDIKDYQLSGLDAHDSGATRFEVTAKVPGGTTKEQFRVMQQNLLAERFKLVIHRAQKEMTTYDLVVGKNGHKMKVSPPAIPGAGPPQPPRFTGRMKRDENGFPILPAGRTGITIMMGDRAIMRVADKTMDNFAEQLSNQLHLPVTNATGLTEKFDFTLAWFTEAAPTSSDDTGPTLFQAVQQQLGLKLEQKKGMVDIIVVDHIEKMPTENW